LSDFRSFLGAQGAGHSRTPDIQPGTSEQDTKTPHRPSADAGFFTFGTSGHRPLWRGMMKLYSQKDVDKKALKGARIAVLGYGSQGRAHALNLSDSGFDVVVGVRKGGAGWKKAKKEGLAVAEPIDAVADADLVAMLVPDMAQKSVYESVEKSLEKGATLLFAHGFNVHFKQIEPRKDLDVVLIAPKGPGDLVRRQYQQGRGVPCLIAVFQDSTGKAHAKALSYAHGIGGTRGGVLDTTFAEETETDLFGEQAVLCGGATELVVKGFETLVEAGYQPEVAYYECMHELKLIVDLLHEGGLTKMHEFISETAKYGDLTRGPRVVTDRTKKEMRKILKEVQTGKFAKQWIEEYASGRKGYDKMLKEDTNRQIEKVGAELRARMPWLNDRRA
jgi:ketol-acid reductoisomerase